MTITSEGVSQYGAISDFDKQRYDQADVLNRDTKLLDRVSELYEALSGMKVGKVTISDTDTSHNAAIADIGDAYIGGHIVATINALSVASASAYVTTARIYDASGTTKVEIALDAAPGAGEHDNFHRVVRGSRFHEGIDFLVHGAGPGVHFLRSIEGDGGNAVADVVTSVFKTMRYAHGPFLPPV